MISRQDIVSQARKYLGVKYKHQGRTAYGLDCLGLIVRVAHDLKLSDADSSDYGRIPDGIKMMSLLEQHLDIVSDIEPGNILLFRYESNPKHLAIVTDNGIIHSYAEDRKVVEHRLDDVWLERLVRIYSFRGI